MLLQNIPSPTSYKDLKVDQNGKVHDSYAKCCEARGLIKNDQEYMDSMEEAAAFGLPKALRNFFVMLLVFNQPTNAGAIWEKYKTNMSCDLKERFNGDEIMAYNCAFLKIREKFIQMAFPNRNFENEFPDLPHVNVQDVQDQISDFFRGQLMDDVNVERQRMNDEQGIAFDAIADALDNRATVKNKCFFLYSPGGCGKTFVYKAIHRLCIAKGYEVRSTAYSGIAATLLPKGMTNHKLLKLPVPITSESLSLIELGSPEALALKSCDCIIWDEASMSQRSILEACDTILKDIMKSTEPFGGKILLLGGDFRQTLPIKRKAFKEEIVGICMNRSHLWKEFQIFKFKKNMRANANAENFAADVLAIGDGTANDEEDMVKIPAAVVTKKPLHIEIFEEIIREVKQSAPKNDTVKRYNDLVLSMLPGREKTYISVDHAEDWLGPPLDSEVLATYYDANFSVNMLRLKNGAIVILLRNLTIEKGLCNGTRLRVIQMGERVLKCAIITGTRAGKEILLPRITLIDTEHFSCQLHRHQFPVKLAFAMTINKSQGQTFEKIGLDLSNDVFAHGQLYVGLSRAHSWEDIKVALPKSNKNNTTKNIVWKEVFEGL